MLGWWMLFGVPLRKFGGHVHHLDHDLSLQPGYQSNFRTIVFEDVDILTLIFYFNSTTMGCIMTLTMSVWIDGRSTKEVLRYQL